MPHLPHAKTVSTHFLGSHCTHREEFIRCGNKPAAAQIGVSASKQVHDVSLLAPDTDASFPRFRTLIRHNVPVTHQGRRVLALGPGNVYSQASNDKGAPHLYT
ncbi:hypothetical protein CH63R_09077 [Colletotrichum higginsianum IMI 349063]|uniref:Uncharacterized protein n=1 Tax=Colletotrichum higginsianum (strain IMI 349063) TaxID=759273 RepID=A0A1B7Y6E1_COLHI|nr:hypothetical protein CH63R_09077 [Colletotrichum higginsianum IMI 349063]OBR07556.1 hypothetical protein CH63R_09077 [Colletotrichum higginsianum IMI 349063]